MQGDKNSTPPALLDKGAIVERLKNLKERVTELREDIDKKASKNGLAAEVEALEREIKESKKMATKALEKPHGCIQTEAISDIRNNIQVLSGDMKSANGERKRTFYWLFGLLTMLAVPTIAAWITMDKSVATNTHTINAVQIDVDEIKKKQEELPKEIKAEMKEQQFRYEKQLNEKTELIIEAIRVRVEPRRRTNREVTN